MAITKFSREYHEKMFPGYESKFLITDPEFIERFDNFAFDEVINQDDMLTAKGIKLPLENQATTYTEDRLEKGIWAQVDIFGDYYTRKGLDYNQREMIHNL